ncbi:sensor histidine kinase [Natranaerobius thermophilus]|uniref:Signal transduction histidine kinase regulating citrate/malate metabolism n=1 Tax=Natranaerobius thermophilus (strain ATCC BAA-1301 / DSM 18059 / JW/NM-WN-LF) TaxID=457570 RepID=B2A4G8_NATTJ|nr:GHKL domain-containing protein [Natranaerobius thermophilus]ACB85145.1 signal transduction histidine kinase regulating citrate/malate metabolism [Natranaerobius thermophilus JW/NM-WN-LF]
MNHKKFITISLIQTMIIVVITVILISSELFKLEQNWLWLYFLIMTVVIIGALNIYFLFRIERSMSKEKELAMLRTDLKNTESLINLLRQQGHDHINHIQTVTSMLILEEYDTAKDYLQGIVQNYRFTGDFLRLGNPTLTALVNTKKELANKNGLEFIVEKYCRVKLNKIKPWDISSIVGNLIENAMEHVLSNKDLPQKIYFNLEHTENMKGYRFKISNPYNGELNEIKNFFAQGFSSKKASGRGYGLSIVKNIVDSYNGKIDVFKENGNITFLVELME